MPIYLYAEITEGTAERVITDLRGEPRAGVEVRINSPGGLVSEGLAIYNALRGREATVYIDGVAASIASLIAMAGKRVVMAANGLLMVHNPWGQAVGDSEHLRRQATTLDKHRDAMIAAYQRSRQSRARIVELLDAETWLDAGEALDLGFIDEIAEPIRYAAHAAIAFAGYRHTPERLIMPQHRNSTPAPDAGTIEAFRSGLSADSTVRAVHDSVMANLDGERTAGEPGAGRPNEAGTPAGPSALAVVQDRERVARIHEMAEQFADNGSAGGAIRRAVATACANGTSVADFGQRLLGIIGTGAAPLSAVSFAGDIQPSHDANDFVAAASDALALRGGVSIPKPHPGSRDLRGQNILAMANICLSRAGRRHDGGAGFAQTISAAMSTGDFPAILQGTIGKALRIGYEAEPRTFEAWTRLVYVDDFKPQTRAILGSSPELLKVAELGEYENGSLTDDQSLPYAVERWGRILSLSFEAMRNDDLGAFMRVTQGLGQAAARAEADAVYLPFSENAYAGPVMQDSTNLFHSNHGNITASQTGLDAAALGAARVLLRRQKAVGGGVLNLTPKYLLVPPELESAAEALLAAASRAMSQGSNNELVPSWLSRLDMVVEPRLTAGSAYVLADPAQIDTYERAHLEGEPVPSVIEKDGFRTDDHHWRCRHVFGGRWLDWRGVVRIPISGG